MGRKGFFGGVIDKNIETENLFWNKGINLKKIFQMIALFEDIKK